MFSNHLSLVKCLVSPCCLCTCVYMCVLARVYAFVLPCSSLPRSVVNHMSFVSAWWCCRARDVDWSRADRMKALLSSLSVMEINGSLAPLPSCLLLLSSSGSQVTPYSLSSAPNRELDVVLDSAFVPAQGFEAAQQNTARGRGIGPRGRWTGIG